MRERHVCPGHQDLFQLAHSLADVPHGYGLKVCVTDRSDYYHKIGASIEPSRSNIVWPPMKLKDVLQFKANSKYQSLAQRQRQKIDRTVHGVERAGHRPDCFSLDPED